MNQIYKKCENPETTKCICFNNTTSASRNVSSISIQARKRDNIKGNPVTCPLSIKSRENMINHIKEINTTNQLQTQPPKLTLPQRLIQILIRMRYYIHTSSYLVKKQGTYEDFQAHTLELENLTIQLTEGRDHLTRLMETYADSNHEETNRAHVRQAEVTEAYLT